MDILWILIAIIVLAGLWIALSYNALVRGRNQVEAAWGQIDVQLKRRHDLIPNLVEVVKDYMSYEQETLTRVIEARNKAVAVGERGTRDEAIEAEAGLGAALGRLFALFENYPDLKANENVAKLQEELTSTENRIAFARQHYNDSVMTQNNRVETFPSNIVADMFNFMRGPYFETPEEERDAFKVDLR